MEHLVCGGDSSHEMFTALNCQTRRWQWTYFLLVNKGPTGGPRGGGRLLGITRNTVPFHLDFIAIITDIKLTPWLSVSVVSE